jgi:hypothetical protein
MVGPPMAEQLGKQHREKFPRRYLTQLRADHPSKQTHGDEDLRWNQTKTALCNTC